MSNELSELTILDIYGLFRKKFVEIMNMREVCKETCLNKICNESNSPESVEIGQERPFTICEEIKELDHRTLYEFKNQCYNYTVLSNNTGINNCTRSGNSLPKCLCGQIAVKVNEFNMLKFKLNNFINTYSEFSIPSILGSDIQTTLNYLNQVLQYADNMQNIMDNFGIFNHLKQVPKGLRVLKLEQLLLLPKFRNSARLKKGNVKIFNYRLKRNNGTKKIRGITSSNILPSKRKINSF